MDKFGSFFRYSYISDPSFSQNGQVIKLKLPKWEAALSDMWCSLCGAVQATSAFPAAADCTCGGVSSLTHRLTLSLCVSLSLSSRWWSQRCQHDPSGRRGCGHLRTGRHAGKGAWLKAVTSLKRTFQPRSVHISWGSAASGSVCVFVVM